MFQLGHEPKIMSQLCRQTYMAKERLSFTSLHAIGQLTHSFEDVKNMAETSKIHAERQKPVSTNLICRHHNPYICDSRF